MHKQTVLVVLDDDPTGSETVRDVQCLLNFGIDTLITQLKRDDKLFYVMTNTRYMSQRQAASTITRFLSNFNEAISQLSYQQPIQLISRSDSFLRGFFPLEVEAIRSFQSAPHDGTIVCQGLFEDDTVTYEDTHCEIR
jgi:uncharacterized protein YgbK (DUF1537 family)